MYKAIIITINISLFILYDLSHVINQYEKPQAAVAYVMISRAGAFGYFTCIIKISSCFLKHQILKHK